MKFRWLVDIDTEWIKQNPGLKIKQITRGGIVVGETDGFDSEGEWGKVPIIELGVEIEFEEEPTTEQLRGITLLSCNISRLPIESP